jgi:predicted nucleic acid-binding protein
MITHFQTAKKSIFTSVITITEVLPKPVSVNHEELVEKFMNFLMREENINLLEISPDIAEKAGRLRGKYKSLKTMDAIQIATAITTGIDAFVTNDIKLKQINEIKIIVLNDYL